MLSERQNEALTLGFLAGAITFSLTRIFEMVSNAQEYGLGRSFMLSLGVAIGNYAISLFRSKS